ncbi:hypothetical protein GC102_09385 [Paenibacillus sp. LMG 31460]|uniref:Heparinase II/III-like C-terminal domain-containing protein n=1 Tax=Paenibacillus germinis TaxID=2654979 RepID=A0ABX1YYC1_9BACL|nr:heparinase II/III family protein [Paenibacillus germinis]NOU85987.1 hypothetical protein [Paenibacillus germinis]
MTKQYGRIVALLLVLMMTFQISSIAASTGSEGPPYKMEKTAFRDWAPKQLTGSIVSKLSNALVIYAGNNNAYVNNNRVKIDANNPEVNATKIDDMLYVPVSFVVKSLQLQAPVQLENNTLRFTFANKSVDVASKPGSYEPLVPIQTIATALDKSVYENESGLLVVSDSQLSFEPVEISNMINAIVTWDSTDIKHPIRVPTTSYPNQLILMFPFFGDMQGVKKEELDTTLTKPTVDPVMALSDSSYLTRIQTESLSRKTLDARPNFEKTIRQMSFLYSTTKDETYSKRAIQALYRFAKDYSNIPKITKDDLFHAFPNYVPVHAVYAYDLVYNSSQWDQISSQVGEDARSVVETWLRSTVIDMYNLNNGFYYSNLVPYAIKAVFGVASVLNDPELIRLVLPWVDTYMGPDQFFADGFWQEATITYHGQMVNTGDAALLLESCFKDPQGYIDNQFRLKLDHTNLSNRWPMLQKGKDLMNKMKFPNGQKIFLNDTDHFVRSQKDPILPEYLSNIELNASGYYALTQGDTENATQVSLTFPPIAGGLPYSTGHAHGDHLQLTLWGSGSEVFPDPGYPRGRTSNGFYHMSSQAHNIGWVWSKKAGSSYTSRSHETRRASQLAYDPGTKNGKQVQLLEASSPGPIGDLAEMNRRMILLMKVDGNKSYVLDLQRLKGGDAHESYLRAIEEEDTNLETSLQLQTHDGTDMAQYLKSTGHEEGLSEFRNLMKNPKTGSGEGAFSFSWIGKDTGVAVKSFINGVPGAETYFTRVPTLRKTLNKTELQNNFPGYQLYRRNLVSPDTVTKYAGVYETWKSKTETPQVENVRWIYPEDPTGMTIAAVVTTKDYEDIVYISNDSLKRSVEGITFSGKVSIVRKARDNGEILWIYHGEEGNTELNGSVLTGKKDQTFKVLSTTDSIDGTSPNTMTLDGIVENAELLKNQWVQTEFSDTSGWGLKVVAVDTKDHHTVLTLEQPPAFEVVNGGGKWLYWPNRIMEDGKFVMEEPPGSGVPYVIPGDVKVHISLPTFIVDQTPPAISVSNPKDGSVYDDSEELRPQFTLTDDLSGVDNSKTTVTLDTYAFQMGTTIPLYSLPLGQHTLLITSTDISGKQGIKTVQFQTAATVDSLKKLVALFLSTNNIDNVGIANSLQAKLTNNELKSFVNEVKAQSGKHISNDTATLLLRDANYILSHN